jgi:hypothetical protein
LGAVEGFEEEGGGEELIEGAFDDVEAAVGGEGEGGRDVLSPVGAGAGDGGEPCE